MKTIDNPAVDLPISLTFFSSKCWSCWSMIKPSWRRPLDRSWPSGPISPFITAPIPAMRSGSPTEVKPTVILQDWVMPSIDGLDLLELFRANPGTAEIPIIVLSSEEIPDVKRRAFAAGANDYVVKLPDKAELIALASNTIRRLT